MIASNLSVRGPLACTCAHVRDVLVEDACRTGVVAETVPDPFPARWTALTSLTIVGTGTTGGIQFPATTLPRLTTLRVHRAVDARFWTSAFAACPRLVDVEYVPIAMDPFREPPGAEAARP